MPKEDIDYSNTIIYKIYCKDPDVTYVYVGHTTNFTQRKYSHKLSCNSTTIKLKIYEQIRENGGWDNWDMIEIAKYNCKDHTEAKIKEKYHLEELTCSLNNKYACKICNIIFNTELEYTSHLNLNSHNKKCPFVDNEDNEKVPSFFCKICD